jgi:hypothetical protein
VRVRHVFPVFATYVALILLGIVVYTIVGLTHN